MMVGSVVELAVSSVAQTLKKRPMLMFDMCQELTRAWRLPNTQSAISLTSLGKLMKSYVLDVLPL